jgi:hypothetical protein
MDAILDPKSTPAQMIAYMIDKYGPKWFFWDPAVIRAELVDDGIEVNKLPDGNFDKVMASKNLILNNTAWQDWDAFLAVGQACNGMNVDFEVARPLSPAEVGWTVFCMNEIKEEQYSAEVQSLIAAILLNEGICYAPNILNFCQDELNIMQNAEDDIVLLVKNAYETYDGRGFMEDPIDICVVKLLAIDKYIEEMRGDAQQ